MEKSIAKFEIIDTLFIFNKISLVGNILEGNFDDGDFIVFEKDKEMFERKIIGLSTISNIERKLIISLTIECENKVEKENFRNWNPNSVIAKIISQ